MRVKVGREWSENEPRSPGGGEVSWPPNTGPFAERHSRKMSGGMSVRINHQHTNQQESLAKLLSQGVE